MGLPRQSSGIVMMEVKFNASNFSHPEEKCVDFHHLSIATGQLYIPGTDPCIICLCDQGKPLWCQAVRCAASKDCLFYTTGRSCCEFVCMDRAVEGKSGGSSYQYFSFLLNLQLEYRLNEQPN